MTLIYGVFDPQDGVFQLVRAGHPPACFAIPMGEWNVSVQRSWYRHVGRRIQGPPRICEGKLEVGDSLFCYTDGLDEAIGPEGERFGEARVQAVFAKLVQILRLRFSTRLPPLQGHSNGGRPYPAIDTPR